MTVKTLVRGPRHVCRNSWSLLGLCILAASLGACNKLVGKGTITSATDATGTKQVQTTVDQSSGKTSATIVANSTTTQVVQVPSSSPVAGTSLAIPPGSLGVATDVTIELAAPLVNPGNTAALGIDGGSTVVGKAVSIQPTQPIDALKPFTVSLAVPSASGLNLDDINANLYVMYKVQNVQAGTVTLGIIPRSALTVTGGTLSFTLSFFGAYQAAVSVKPITVAVQVPVVSAPILTQHAAAALPPLAVTARAPFIVGAGSTVTITGTNFRPTMTLALGGKPVTNLKVASDTSASFTAPNYQGFGLSKLTADQDGSSTQSAVVYYTGTYADYPVSSKAVSEICAGEKFYDSAGGLQTGTRNCTIPAACAADGIVGCVTVTGYPSAKLANFSASNVPVGITIAGVVGSGTSSPLNCSADGATSCVANATYTAALTTGLASKVLSSATVAGVAGNVTLPAASNVLTGVTYGTSGTGSTGSLTLPTAANVRTTNGAYGVGGTATTPTLANCSSDGQTGCVTSAILPAAAITGFSTWDIRAGTTLAGLAGTLKTNCRNAVNNTYFNYDGVVAGLPSTGVTSGTAFDYWDTVDDYYGFAANKVTAWSSDTYCGSTTWTDVTTTDGGTTFTTCALSAANCQYKDNITNLVTTKVVSASSTWTAAVNACASSTYGGYAAGTWRLPTQRELQSQSEHGVVSLVSANFMTLANLEGAFWSSSTTSDTTTGAWYVQLANGATWGSPKTSTNFVTCVK